ncbi:MAG: phage antirepressor protein [Candidatus Diapherotrites archaeon]|uniref:Phage antirepressor protein n=1 Tax=Candidatus Iainarchaeum sp. TaxID=3101447 RepID=A0A8T4CB00_9ARCH|nr:phage antirepressor protein [Candidatus Diapherotrites archaeon]
MEQKDTLIVFQDSKIRRILHNNEWWFVLEDIVQAVTDSKDPKQYISKLKQRDEPLAEGWVHFVRTLSIDTPGGKQGMNCVNTAGGFRIIQSIPSPKAEPFKQWLAKVGYERVQEIQDPELAQKRMYELYRAKGYSDEWIDARMRGIKVRDDLTSEWKKRDVKEGVEFAIITAEISSATFGMTPNEYKDFKGLKKENLRDHMNDLELIFTMLGEASTAHVVRGKNAQGFVENQHAAVTGGTIAGNACKELENKSGEKVSTNENYLTIPESQKRLERSAKKQIP